MENVIDILLQADLKKPEQKEYKLKRLSGEQPVIFTIRSLSYDRFTELHNAPEGDFTVHLLLAGVVQPDFKDQRLLDKFSAATPVELVKKMLLPGEISAVGKAIERLSGFGTPVIEEIKKK